MKKGTGHHGDTIAYFIQNSLRMIIMVGHAVLGPENDVRLDSK